MIRLEKSEALGQKIRQDDPVDLAIPTWTLVREAIQAGKVDEALDFLEYGCSEASHDSLVSFVDDVLTHLASFGEEELEKVLRQRYYPRASALVSKGQSVEVALQQCTQSQRGHQGNFVVTEEPDRYVVRLDPCGSGGRLMRTKSVGTTKKAYPWSWNKSGIPYYCCHCCVSREILPTELRGYPIRINLVPEKPEDPCVHLYYKKPELIPEEYFTRIGKTKTIK